MEKITLKIKKKKESVYYFQFSGFLKFKADESDEVDNEAYFQQMTAIIRDMAKSPSMILSKNEADFIMGQFTKTVKLLKKLS